MSPQPQTRQQLGCASQYHIKGSWGWILSMGVLNSWEEESANLNVRPQLAVREP